MAMVMVMVMVRVMAMLMAVVMVMVMVTWARKPVTQEDLFSSAIQAAGLRSWLR
jgi:hypothetical protein